MVGKIDDGHEFISKAIWLVNEYFDLVRMHLNAHKVDVSKWKESGETKYGGAAIFRIFCSKADGGNRWRCADRIELI